MTFLVGAIVGVLVGFAAATVFTLRGREHRDGERRPGGRRSLATVIAALALVVAVAAFVRSGHHERNRTGGSTIAGTTSTVPNRASTTTPVTASHATVSVPNLVGLARELAVEKLQNAGLRATFAALALSNVPPGFVISQSPLPGGLVAPGAAVSLVVSSKP